MRALAAIVFAATTLIGGCAVGDEDGIDDSVDENGEPIIGGSVDYGDPAVGMVRNALSFNALTGRVVNWTMCTGTLVAPNIMVTAAHCYTPGALWTDVTFTTTTDKEAPMGSPGWVQGTIIKSPLYNGNAYDGHDVAIVVLSRPLATVPLKRGPTPAVGTAVRAIGYGMNVFGQNAQGVGTKRHIVLGVSAIQPHVFKAGYEGHNVCHGDSGGPVVQNGRIVGVNDYVDTPDCHGAGYFVRLEDNLGFLRTYIPAF